MQLNMDPVLDMSPEHASSREQTLINAEFLYDLLCIILVPLEQYALLSSVSSGDDIVFFYFVT